jgi:hypothetical protein
MKKITKSLFLTLITVFYLVSLHAQNLFAPIMDKYPSEYAAKEVTNSHPLPVLPKGSIAYGAVGYGPDMGWVSFDVDHPNNPTLITTTHANIFGGDYLDELLYAYNQTGDFLKIESKTGLTIQTVPQAWDSFMSDMAYDYSTNTMYGIKGDKLYTINISTGVPTQVAVLTGFVTPYMWTLAVDFAGNMYGVEVNGYGDAGFYAINKTTGACTLIGNTQKAVNFVQSMGFDHSTGILYWCQFAPGDANFLKIDLETGATTLVEETGREICGFHIPSTPVTPCYPASDLTITYTSDCEANLSWTAVGDDLSFHIYRDEALIQPNYKETSYTDTGFDIYEAHTWEVIVVCSDGGESLPAGVAETACDEMGIYEKVQTAFAIVPNPATNHITIAAETIFHTVEVVNFLGQTMLSQQSAGKSAILDISHLTNGAYFVRITSDKGISVQRFMKQKF